MACSLLAAWALWASGCGKLVGDVKIDTRGTSDAGTGVDQQGPLALRPPCQPGELRCQGPVLQACEPDGSGWLPRERCQSAALCVDAPGEPSRCLEPSCEPGVTCEGAELRECNADRTGLDTIDVCESAAHCDAMSGGCEATRCTPGEVTCNGATLQRCNDGPTGHDVIATCETAALCDDLRAAACAGQQCDVDGAVCPAPACAAGELRCSGTRLEVCSPGRNGWDFVDECVTPGVCEATRANPAALSCIEPPCDPGDVICSPDGARLSCNLDRTAYSVEISRCQPDACTPAGCEADPCTVGELSCNGATLQECQLPPEGGRPRRVDLQACATRQLCELSLARSGTSAPACVPAACAPGEFDCAGRQMQVCNAGRTDFVNVQLCATDGLCEAGIGLGACPTPCSGAACNGSMLRTCNQERTALVDTEDCGTPAECDAVAGRCADPCVPGVLRCNGNALERCESRLEGWQRLETCASAGLCQASVSDDRLTCTRPPCSQGEHRCDGQRLQVCAPDLTGFITEKTCATGEICDAPNQQCDVCVPNAVRCDGDVFSRCAANGQSAPPEPCGSGLCSASGPNVGCLQCDPVGSSRCAGALVLTCSAQNTEVATDECVSADLCRVSGGSAVCADSQCSGPLQCTNQGEVLVCNAGQTGYVSQSPPVVCETPALCDATVAGGCRPAACAANQRQCDGAVVEVCNATRTDFVAETTCSAGFSCVQDGEAASCACVPGSYRCTATGLSRCNGTGTAFADVAGDIDCDGADRVSCNVTTLVRDSCADAAHCLASSGASCAECVPADCPDDGSFCNGAESCDAATGCESSGNPCTGGLICSEAAGACVQCVLGADCAPGQSCIASTCVTDPVDGGT